MSGAELVVRAAVRMLPLHLRERYREQWAADLRDAEEAGLRRSSIATGALIAAIGRHDLDATVDPSVRQIVLVRTAIAAFGVAGVAAFGAYTTGTSSSIPGDTVSVVDYLQLILSLVQSVVVGAALLVGSQTLVRASISGPSAKALLIATVAVLGAVVGVVAGAVGLVPGEFAVPLCLLVFVSALAALTLWATIRGSGRLAPRVRGAATTSRSLVVGGAVMLAVIAWGVAEALVLMPLALAPGYELAEIYRALEGELLGDVLAVGIWATVWLGAGAVVILAGRRLPARLTATLVLGVIAAAVWFQWWAGFGMANGVSDALPPYTGGNSPVAPFYWFVGQLALVAVIARIVPAAPQGTAALGASRPG